SPYADRVPGEPSAGRRQRHHPQVPAALYGRAGSDGAHPQKVSRHPAGSSRPPRLCRGGFLRCAGKKGKRRKKGVIFSKYLLTNCEELNIIIKRSARSRGK